MQSYHILTDEDVATYLTMPEAIEAMESPFREQANSTLVAPSRFHISVPKGRMVFTAGAATEWENVLGFRVYNIFPQSQAAKEIQLVTVFDAEDGSFKGLILGKLIGVMRTGAINGVAMRYMARQDAAVLAILGAGQQARIQVQAAMAVRDFKQINLYNRTLANAELFRDEILAQFNVSCSVFASAKAAVENADVIIAATTSRTPVIKTEWLQAGTHIHGIGPNRAGASELPADIAQVCEVIATDSLAQVNGYAKPFYIEERERIVGLEQIVVGNTAGRSSESAITLFCSTGLAGTEVVLANRLLEKYKLSIKTH